MSIISGFVPRFDSSLTSSKVLVCSRTAVSSEMSQTHAHHTRDGTNRTGKPFSRSTERKTSVDPSYRVQQHGRKKQKEKKPTEATHTWTWTGHHWRRFLWCARAASLCPNPLSIERSGVEKKPVFLRRLLVPQPPPFAFKRCAVTCSRRSTKPSFLQVLRELSYTRSLPHAAHLCCFMFHLP